jgi:hypothetical protein
MGVHCVCWQWGERARKGAPRAHSIARRGGESGEVLTESLDVSPPLLDLRGEDEVGPQGLGPQGLPVDGAAALVAQPPGKGNGVKSVSVAVHHRLPHDRQGDGTEEVLRGLQPQRGCGGLDAPRLGGVGGWARGRWLAGEETGVSIGVRQGASVRTFGPEKK